MTYLIPISVVLLLFAQNTAAQQTPAPPSPSASTSLHPAASQQGGGQSAEPQPDQPGAHGAVLFSRDLTGSEEKDQQQTAPAAEQPSLAPGDSDPLHVTDAERTALTFTAYALDLHLTPATHAIAAQAELELRNDGPTPLPRLVVQVSSSLHWDEFLLRPASGPVAALHWTSRRLATDADHTGWVSEAVVTLPTPLAPGATLRLRAVYSGAIAASAERLERIGAPPAEAAAADWDAIDAPGPGSPGTSVALRGFGDVLWYPAAAPPLFLGDGAKLVEAAGRMRLREQNARMTLRLTSEFAGDPPDAVFFCGRPGTFSVVHDNPDMPVAEGTGVATATFIAAPLGFRVPSLFITDHPATPTGTEANPDLIAAVTENFDALKTYSAAAQLAQPLLTDWLGPHPERPLHLLDHPGLSFEDNALLVGPIGIQTASELAPGLVHSLSHAWFRSQRPWIDEGLAEFMQLLWTERTQGRPTALAQLEGAARTISLAEPAPPQPEPALTSSTATATGATTAANTSSSSASNPGERAPGPLIGQPLVQASSDIFYRTKAAAVWWMLRGIVGDGALKRGLAAYGADPALDRDPEGVERALERVSHQDLRWFFTDWVYTDPGLPDLTIVNVTPRQIATTNRPGGWLVSVEVRNDGEAVADVPVTVRSAPGASGTSAASETQRLRIPAHTTVTRRIVFAVTPVEVQVNDGSVPELRVSVHTEQLTGTGPR